MQSSCDPITRTDSRATNSDESNSSGQFCLRLIACAALFAILVAATPAFAQAPVANDDNTGTGLTAVTEGGSINLSYNVLDNDTSATAMTAVQISGDPANAASFQLNSDGTFTYTHDGTETSSDSFTYQADNGAPSNTATVTITINNTNDTPVLSLNGAGTIDLGTGDAYVEQGASATDEEDNDVPLTNSISVGGDTVDTATPGTYVVTYDVTDSGGAAAVQITRTVNVVDDDAPVITLTPPTTIDLDVGDSYSDPGFSATDNVDGDITGNVNVGGDTVDTGTPGTYVVTYDVADAAGNNATQQTRTINVSTPADVTPPVITLTPPTTINLSVGVSYSEPGFSANDNIDGDITGNVNVGGDTVNTGTPGTYVVTYNVADAAGNNATQVTRTINVADTTPPVISLTGATTINLSVGDPYSEPGFSATDNVDGNVTGNVNVGGDTVNTGSAGTYVVTYNVADAAGNNATQVTRTINVADTTPPVITLTPPTTINLNVGASYSEPGFSATDNVDGDITGNVNVGGDTVNTNVANTYVVTYNVADAAGNNATQVTRTINVTDGNPPVITLVGPAVVNLTVGDAYTEQGANAVDPEEGAVTVIVGGDTVNTNVAATYTVTYNASDSAGNNAVQVSRTVNVTDGNPPVITLNGAATINLAVGDVYTEQGASAVDPEEGAVAVVIGGDTVNTNVSGTYIVTYNAADSAGNNAVQVTRTVNVADGTPPVITLTGPAIINLNVGEAYNEQGATAVDPQDGSVAVVIGGDTVNTAVSGVYVVTYDAADSAGNNAVQVTRTVNVNSAPTITILGDNPAQVTEGAVYTDAGATASDPEDGDLTASITTDDTVDTSTPGSYSVTYSVTDSGGETTNAVRTVTVGANVAPTITGQAVLTTPEETALEIVLANLTVTDPDNTFPTDFTLTVQDGANYVRVGNVITPVADFVGDLSVPVTVNDGLSDSPVFNVVVTVTDVNDPPVATPQSLATDEDIPLAITLTGTDPENAVLTFVVAIPPLNGALSGTVPDLVYTPALDFSGNDTFTFTVNDGVTTSAPATISIAVNAVNDPPTVLLPIEDQVGVEGSPFNFSIAANFEDGDGDVLTYAATGLPVSGNIVFNTATGAFSGTPRQADARDNDPYIVTVTASDGDIGGITAVDDFALNISALDRANVSLDISATPDPAMQSAQVSWTYTVLNSVGPQVATNVVLDGSFFGEFMTVGSTAACTIQPPVGQITSFSCTVGNLPVGGSASVVITTTTSGVGDVATYAFAAVADPVPIDPNLDDNAEQDSVGIAAAFSNGAVDVLGNSNIRSVAFGDINGDTAGDLVVGTAAGQQIQVWLSDGFRGFGPAPMIIADQAANEGVALADFNEDGNLDVVVANGGGAADKIYAGDGTGNFTLMLNLPASFSRDVAVGDFNNDNNMDVVFATAAGNPVYLGNGAGGMSLHATLGNANSMAVAVGQLNTDAQDDVVFANVGGPSRVWLKTAGTFAAGSTLAIGDAVSVTAVNLGGSPQADLAFGRVSTGLNDVPANPVIINNGTGVFGAPTILLGSAPTLGIHSGDINDDGSQDLVFINQSGAHQIWINSGGAFALHGEQIFSDGSVAGVVGNLGFTDVGDAGGEDLAMGGVLQPGLGVYLNDGFGNLGKGDAVAPTLVLNGAASVAVPFGSVYTDEGATAEDNIDGTISDRIVVTNPVNTSALGAYTVVYNVTDAAGNAAAQITRTVNVAPDTGGGGGGGGSLNIYVAFLLLMGALFATYRRRNSLFSIRIEK